MTLRRFLAKGSSSASLYLYGSVGGGWFSDGITAKSVADAVKELVEDGVTSLTCYVNSNGGDVFEGFAVYNVLTRFPGSVTMCIDGVAASAASIICMAGKTIAMSSAGMMMIHEARTYGGGTADELEKAAELLGKINESMVAVYAERTKQPPGDIRTMMADETWFTAAEAQSKGFCDRILRADDDKKAADRASTMGAEAKTQRLARIAAYGTHRKGSKPMGKKNKVSAFTLYKLGLPPDATDADVMAALDGLQERARSADVTKAKLDADARLKAAADDKARREREGDPDPVSLAAKASLDAAGSDKARADSERRLIDLTGAKTYGEALGMVTSWKSAVTEMDSLRARITELEGKSQGATAEMLVEKGIQDKKIAPAQKELFLAMGRKDPEMLKGYLATAATLLPKKAAVSPEHKIAVALTDEQKRAAEKLGLKPEAITKISEQLAEAQAIRGAG